MIYADCKDKICKNHKEISKSNESIICLPNKVEVTVISDKSEDVDGWQSEKIDVKRLCTLALMISLAFAFSYLESLVPFNFGIPGIKLGLANLVVIVALYTMNFKDAFFISLLRIVLSGLIFNGIICNDL